jgi:predicted phage replisome organizer
LAEVKWIKITTDMFDDEKIRLIESMPEGDAILVTWIKLLTLAGKTNDNGTIYLTETIPYTEDMLSTICRRPLQIIRLALQTFEKLEMIAIENGIINIVNWEKHQNIERLQQIREQTRTRVARFREKQRLLSEPVTLRNAEVTQQNKNKNKNIYMLKNGFNLFWERYPKKLAKRDAEKAFAKINPDEKLFNLILEKLELYKQSEAWLKDGGQFIPYPATWLNGRRWEDEITPAIQGKKARYVN